MIAASCSMILQRFPADKAYFIAKEVSTTERTYLKDLEVIASVRVASPPRLMPLGCCWRGSLTLAAGL